MLKDKLHVSVARFTEAQNDKKKKKKKKKKTPDSPLRLNNGHWTRTSHFLQLL